MNVIEAPAVAERADLFLAGGITGARLWQQEAIGMLAGVQGSLFNPRRSHDFREEDADEQVEWEYRALRRSGAILFWFPPETLCPITLYELGVWGNQHEVPVFVGTDSGYLRRFDVVKQMSLAQPGLTIHDSLDATVDAYIAYHHTR